MEPEFWKGKRVLITGHTGFKGTWLAAFLKRMDAQVFGYSLPPNGTENELFDQINPNWQSSKSHQFGDIRDLSEFRSFFENVSPDILLHLAAQPLVRQSYADPVETFSTNVMGTANVLEAIRSNPSENLGAVVIVTSDKCYLNKEWVWPYRESDRLGGHDPYSASKACAELVTESYQKSFFLNSDKLPALASARGGNVIGGGDFSKDRIVPDIVRAIQDESALTLRYPGAIRPWQHVLDCLSGYLSLSQKLYSDVDGRFRGAWNFGPDSENVTTVGALSEALIREMGSSIPVKTPNLQTEHEANTLLLDSSKSRKNIGWKGRLGFHETVSWTAEWYQEYLRSPNMASEITERQITKFIDLVLETDQGDL